MILFTDFDIIEPESFSIRETMADGSFSDSALNDGTTEGSGPTICCDSSSVHSAYDGQR